MMLYKILDKKHLINIILATKELLLTKKHIYYEKNYFYAVSYLHGSKLR